MRILFLPMVGTRGIGTLTRLLAINDAAIEQGHQTAFVANSAPLAWLGAQISALYEVDRPPAFEGIEPETSLLVDTANYRGLANLDYLRDSVVAQVKAIQDFEPDVVVSEYNFVARISSHICGIPLASLCTWADHPSYAASKGLRSPNAESVVEVYNQLLEQYSLPPIVDLCELHYLRSDLKLISSAPFLEPQFRVMADAHYVGHLVWPAFEQGSLPPQLDDWSHGCKLIHVYLSVTDIDPTTYSNVLTQAFDGSMFKVAVSVGRHPQLSRLPDNSPNVRFFSRLPGLTVMQRCCLAIHHAGGNISVTSLIAGVPALVFPDRSLERGFHAENLRRLSVGHVFPVTDFLPDVLYQQALVVSSDLAMRDVARRLGDQIVELGGPARALELLEHLA